MSILDPGTSAVKALVVELEDNKATILGRGRTQHLGGLAADGSIGNLDTLKAACEGALRQAEDATEHTRGHKIVPDVALFSVPSAWLCGATGYGSVERPELETAIEVTEFPEPLARAGRQALRHLGRVTGPGDWELLDATLISFSVNDNPVTDPVGFRGHLLAAEVFVVAAPRQALASLRQIADALQLEPPRLVAEPLALAAVSPSDGLIVQVGAASTGLILTRSRAPIAFDSVLQAGTTWTRTCIDRFRLSPARAEAALRAYAGDGLNADEKEAMQKTLQPVLDAWLSELTGTLQSWSNNKLTWSPSIYLCGGASAIPGVQETMARARWVDVLPFSRTPDTRIWDGSNASQVTDLTPMRWLLDSVTTLSLAAWAIRDSSKQTPDSMLRASLELE
jgi:cell division ATPase FtsA